MIDFFNDNILQFREYHPATAGLTEGNRAVAGVGVGYLFGEISVQTSATESYIPTHKYYIVGVGGALSIPGGGVKMTNTYVQQSKR